MRFLQLLLIPIFSLLAACGGHSVFENSMVVSEEAKQRMFKQPTEELTPSTPPAIKDLKDYSVYRVVDAKFGADVSAASVSATIKVESTAGTETVDLVGALRGDGTASLVDLNPVADSKNRLVAEAMCVDIGTCKQIILNVYFNVAGKTKKVQFSSPSLRPEDAPIKPVPGAATPPAPVASGDSVDGEDVHESEKGLPKDVDPSDEQLGDFVGAPRNEVLIGQLYPRSARPELPPVFSRADDPEVSPATGAPGASGATGSTTAAVDPKADPTKANPTAGPTVDPKAKVGKPAPRNPAPTTTRTPAPATKTPQGNKTAPAAKPSTPETQGAVSRWWNRVKGWFTPAPTTPAPTTPPAAKPPIAKPPVVKPNPVPAKPAPQKPAPTQPKPAPTKPAPTTPVAPQPKPAPQPAPTTQPKPNPQPAPAPRPNPAPPTQPAPVQPKPVPPPQTQPAPTTQPKPAPITPPSTGREEKPRPPQQPVPVRANPTNGADPQTQYPFPPAQPNENDGDLDQRLTLLEAKLAPLINLKDGGQSRGGYTDQRGETIRSSIVSASLLPSNIPGLVPVTINASAHFGSGMLVSFLENAATFLMKQLGIKLNVGDMSLKAGGSYGSSSSHNTHRNGLDADIAWIGIDKPLITSALTTEGDVIDNFDYEKTWNFLRLAAHQELVYDAQKVTAVSRIFMSPAVKVGFCSWAKESKVLDNDFDAELMRLIRPTPAHYKHFHLSLKCSPHYRLCRNLAGPPPEGTGCPRN